jgi:hypothetical protein
VKESHSVRSADHRSLDTATPLGNPPLRPHVSHRSGPPPEPTLSTTQSHPATIPTAIKITPTLANASTNPEVGEAGGLDGARDVIDQTQKLPVLTQLLGHMIADLLLFPSPVCSETGEGSGVRAGRHNAPTSFQHSSLKSQISNLDS